MQITVTNHNVEPNTLVVGNQYENDIETLQFSLDVPLQGNLYLVCQHESEDKPYTPLPIVNNKLSVKTFLTQKSGKYDCVLIVSDTTIDDDYDFATDTPRYVSNVFKIYVARNMLNGTQKPWELHPNIQIKFDELVALMKKVKEDLANGAFKGEKGDKGDKGDKGEDGTTPQEVIEIKDQVEKNTQDIFNFSIKNMQNGKLCVITDGTENNILDLKIYGESVQSPTNVFDGTNRISGTIDNSVNVVGSEFKPNPSNVSYIYEKCLKVEKGKQYILTYDYNTLLNTHTRNGNVVDDNNIVVEQAIKTFENGLTRIEFVPKASGWLNLLTDMNVTNIKIKETEQKPTPSRPMPIVDKEISKIDLTTVNRFDVSTVKRGFLTGGAVGEKLSVTTTQNYPNAIYFKEISIDQDKLYSWDFSPVPSSSFRMRIFNNALTITENSSTQVKKTAHKFAKNTTKVQIMFLQGEQDVQGIFNQGSTVSSYEPYKEKSITLSKPLVLKGIGVSSNGNVTIDGKQYVTDSIENGKRFTRILKYTFSGNENFKANTAGGYTLNINEIGSSVLQNTGGLCNRFNYNSKAWVNDGDFGMQSDVLFIVDKNNTLFPTVQDLKDFLKENETYIYYPIKEPTIEPLPLADQEKLKAIKLFYPNTVINTNAFTECTYLADTRLYIDNLVRRFHVNLQIELQASQLAMMSLLPDDVQATMIEKDQENLLGGLKNEQ